MTHFILLIHQDYHNSRLACPLIYKDLININNICYWLNTNQNVKMFEDFQFLTNQNVKMSEDFQFLKIDSSLAIGL